MSSQADKHLSVACTLWRGAVAVEILVHRHIATNLLYLTF